MNRNNRTSYADSVEGGQATTYAGVFYYKHLADLWETQKQCVLGVNDVDLDEVIRKKNLEDWYDMLLIQRDMILPKVEIESEVDAIKSMFKKVADATNNAEFTVIDNTETLQQIKITLREIRAALWTLQFKYGLVMPNKSVKNISEAFA